MNRRSFLLLSCSTVAVLPFGTNRAHAAATAAAIAAGLSFGSKILGAFGSRHSKRAAKLQFAAQMEMLRGITGALDNLLSGQQKLFEKIDELPDIFRTLLIERDKEARGESLKAALDRYEDDRSDLWKRSPEDLTRKDIRDYLDEAHTFFGMAEQTSREIMNAQLDANAVFALGAAFGACLEIGGEIDAIEPSIAKGLTEGFLKDVAEWSREAMQVAETLAVAKRQELDEWENNNLGEAAVLRLHNPDKGLPFVVMFGRGNGWNPGETAIESRVGNVLEPGTFTTTLMPASRSITPISAFIEMPLVTSDAVPGDPLRVCEGRWFVDDQKADAGCATRNGYQFVPSEIGSIERERLYVEFSLERTAAECAQAMLELSEAAIAALDSGSFFT